MDLWQRARVFAEETAKRSQEISISAAKRSQEFVSETAKRSQEISISAAKRSQEFVSETAKKSRDLAAEATKTADLIKTEALRRADQIKSLAADIPIPPIPQALDTPPPPPPPPDLERFGITDELREFVRGITMSTFRDFPMEDEPVMEEVTTVSNVRQDLNEWQATHATLVLSTVKEISKFRYELCPRYMKERKFWRIYFILVNSFVAVYERKYMEELSLKSLEQKQNGAKEIPSPAPASHAESKETKLQSKTSASSTAEHDLDMFLLGDLGSSDEGPDDDVDAFDDDFDKTGNASGLDSEDDHETSSK